MKKNKITYYVKGFTIAEVLVTMALTTIAIAMAYGTLTQVQKLLNSYREQNKFLQQYMQLKSCLDYQLLKATMMEEESENNFRIQADSNNTYLELSDAKILLKKNGNCDTLHFAVKNIQKNYEPMSSPLWQNKLVSTLSFDTEFSKQTFHFRFSKQHDASVKLALDQNDNNGNH